VAVLLFQATDGTETTKNQSDSTNSYSSCRSWFHLCGLKIPYRVFLETGNSYPVPSPLRGDCPRLTLAVVAALGDVMGTSDRDSSGHSRYGSTLPPATPRVNREIGYCPICPFVSPLEHGKIPVVSHTCNRAPWPILWRTTMVRRIDIVAPSSQGGMTIDNRSLPLFQFDKMEVVFFEYLSHGPELVLG
jgi:hypothetical protein